MKPQKIKKIKSPKKKALKNDDTECNSPEESVPKRKKRNAKSLDVLNEPSQKDQTTAKKIKLENTMIESDQASSDTKNKIEESESKKKDYTVEELKKKIEILSSQSNLTKSARKNLAKLKKKLSVQENISPTASSKKQVEEEIKEKVCDSDVTVDVEEKNVKEEHAVQQPTKKIRKKKNEEKLENEVPSMELKKENVDNIKTFSNKEETEKNKTNRINQSKKEIGKEQQKKKRHVLFVGNIPYGATVEDIKNHFLKEVSQVISVRIPTVKKTNEPRGFAYVEFNNSIDYEKGLSLHHSQLNGRRINVQYTQTGSKNAGKKSEIIKKNQLLHSLRKQGKLAGSKKFQSRQTFKKHQEINKF